MNWKEAFDATERENRRIEDGLDIIRAALDLDAYAGFDDMVAAIARIRDASSIDVTFGCFASEDRVSRRMPASCLPRVGDSVWLGDPEGDDWNWLVKDVRWFGVSSVIVYCKIPNPLDRWIVKWGECMRYEQGIT